MTWTTETPTQPGWYWYHDPEINLGKPMPAWVFDANKMWWVTLCAVHGTSGVHGTVGTHALSTCRGHWAGPIVPPDV